MRLPAAWALEALEEALGDGLMAGHPAMAEISYDADEVGDVIACLKSIQPR